jgi:predicted ArsR family transcriptional regulator
MQATRRKIVQILKERGQATVEELADAVGLTQMAVRHHLNVLQAENLVARSSVRREHRPGRPQQLYALTNAADELFPEDYYRLADQLLDEMKASLGPSALDKLFRGIANRLAAEAPSIRPARANFERLDDLVRFLGENGFVAHWRPEGDGYAIQLLTCPYRQIARDHQEVCRLDSHLIGSMLETEPVRATCMARGEAYCTYRVSQPIGLGMGD